MSLQTSIPKSVREVRNYPAIGGSGGNSPAWHRSTGTIEIADAEVLHRDTRVYGILLARLLRNPVVPLNHQDTIARHYQILSIHAENSKGHLDLSPALEELSKLKSAVDRSYDRINSGKFTVALVK
jgi:hypothetical protein